MFEFLSVCGYALSMGLSAVELATRTQTEFDAIAPVALPPLRGEGELVSMGARFVYLDSWCWQELADGRFGRGDFPYEEVRQSVWDGALVLPLSQTHLAELSRYGNPRRRAEAIVAMLELSGMAVVDLDDMQAWDAYVGLCGLHQLDREVGRRRLTWGYESAFIDSTELDRAAAEKRIRSDWRHWSEMPWQRMAPAPDPLTPQSLAHQIGWMCAVDPDPIPHRSEFVDAQQKIQELLLGEQPQRREDVHAFHLAHQLLAMAPYLALASVLLDVECPASSADEWRAIVSKALLDVECPASSADEWRAIVSNMPVSRVWSAMLHQAHTTQTNRNWKKKQSDQIDFFNISVAAALFDLVIVDGPTALLAEQLPPGLHAAEVTNDLSALLEGAGSLQTGRAAA